MAKDDVVMLDSSVVITALLSSAGGSFFVMTNLSAKFRLMVTEYILSEVYDVIFRKFKKSHGMQTELLSILTVGNVQVMPVESVADARILYRVINREDAPILASALQHSRYLLSLDKHFLETRVVQYAAKHGLVIRTPGDFIKNQRSQN